MYADMETIKELVYKIKQAFALKAEAAGSLVRSGTSIVLKSIENAQLSSVDLDEAFATNDEAGHSLSINGRTITLKNVSGTDLNSVTVPEQDLSGLATKAGAVRSAHIEAASDGGDVLAFNNGENPDRTIDYVGLPYIASVGLTSHSGYVRLHFYSYNGKELDSVDIVL